MIDGTPDLFVAVHAVNEPLFPLLAHFGAVVFGARCSSLPHLVRRRLFQVSLKECRLVRGGFWVPVIGDYLSDGDVEVVVADRDSTGRMVVLQSVIIPRRSWT